MCALFLPVKPNSVYVLRIESSRCIMRAKIACFCKRGLRGSHGQLSENPCAMNFSVEEFQLTSGKTLCMRARDAHQSLHCADRLGCAGCRPHPRNSRSAPQVCSAACHFLCTYFLRARIATAFSGSGALEQLMRCIRAALANLCRHVLDRECLVLPNTFVHNEFAVSSPLAILNERRGGLGDYRLNCALDVRCISLYVTQQSMSRCKAAAVVDWRCDVYFASATRRERLFCGNTKATSR